MIGRYGIEACRANIVKEIKAVFDVYGIAVDYRHLSLIGDFITYNGEYRAFNRIGMEESNSPFLKMSYETTMKYLIQSSVTNDTDWMKSPSSALVLGQAPNIGSNVFDLIQAF
jgi:DNA-directed RNA polymerase I subunit RPA1